jgi:tagatose 1,6-diphosphate aldolase
MRIAEGKRRRLAPLANGSGVIAALAMDQRGSLRRALGGVGARDEALREFKAEVSRALTAEASGILLDPEFGGAAAAARAPGCGLLYSYEASGYDKSRPGRRPLLPDGLSVARLKEMGADGIKLLVYYTPFEDAAANNAKHAFVERVGAECAAHGLAFFLEFLTYDPADGDEKSPAYARTKPRAVLGGMAEFSRPRYLVDVLKVELPVVSRYVEGIRAYGGPTVYTRSEALHWLKECSDSSAAPFLYLSAGVDNDVFVEQLELAAEAGSAFSGVLCGRATWKGGIAEYLRSGAAGLRAWLEREGVANIRNINAALGAAKPVWERLGSVA